MIRWLTCLALWSLALPAQVDSRPQSAPSGAREHLALFAPGAVTRFEITLEAKAREQLRAEPRTYVPCSVQLHPGMQLLLVGIKLKGAAGSFREFDDRPGLTLKLDFQNKDQELSGTTRLHLNNAVQDPTWMHEWLGAEVFAAAGQPAPRVAHARVVLDGRDLGLYVLRESFDKAFLNRALGPKAERGNLYDGGFCQDIDAELELDSGSGKKHRGDLKDLVAACRRTKGTANKLEKGLAHAVAIAPFVDFAALEAMLGHWDGYCQNRNNYRLWFDPDGGRAHFLPHGMDQLFGDAGAGVLSHPPALVADAVLARPQWRKLYRERILALLPLFAPERLTPKIRALEQVLRPALLELGEDAAKAHAAAIEDLVTRITARYQSLVEQSTAAEPIPLALPVGEAWHPVTWNAAPESELVTLTRAGGGTTASYQIAIGKAASEDQTGSWRSLVLLTKGRYRLEAQAWGEGIVPPRKGEDGEEHGGACLEVAEARSERILASSPRRALHCEFEVREHQRNVELVMKLAGRAGSTGFFADSITLVRLAP